MSRPTLPPGKRVQPFTLSLPSEDIAKIRALAQELEVAPAHMCRKLVQTALETMSVEDFRGLL